MIPVQVRRERKLRKIDQREQLKYRRFHVRRGDTVRILAGKDRGKQGKVLRVFPRKARILVEKLNIIKKHQKPSARVAKGGIIEREGPIHVSNVMLVCPSCREITRPKYSMIGDKKSRLCRKCSEPMDLK